VENAEAAEKLVGTHVVILNHAVVRSGGSRGGRGGLRIYELCDICGCSFR
jgi:hypothetical protein